MTTSVFISSYCVERNLPLNLKDEDVDLFQHELRREFQTSKIYKLQQVALSGKGIVVIRNKVSLPSLRHLRIKKLGKPQELRLIISSLLSRKSSVERGFFVSDTWSSGYFHWFCDALPIAFKLNRDYKGFILLLPDNLRLSFVQNSLELLQINYQFMDEGNWFSVGQLLTTDLIAPSGNYHSSSIYEMKMALISSASIHDEPHGKRIFISRRQAKRRRLLNEDDLSHLLTSFGFESYVLEDMKHDDQIKLISQASVLMGVHGAGLTNMLFLPPNACVIEIRASEDRHNNCYFSLASALNHPYFYLISETSESSNDHIGDFILSPNQFATEMKNILNLLP